ncbi:MAG: protein kinase domain-containing protein [Polyangia bacterium]
MSCLQEATILRLIAGAVPVGELRPVESHLAECSGCNERLAQASSSHARATATVRAHGYVPTPAAPLPPGSRAGRYVVLGLVGRGGMGDVYAARDPELDRRVALKILHPHREERRAAHTARLRREAKAIARLSHENVVAVHDVGTIGDSVFVAMEFVDGMTVAEWARSTTPRPGWRQVLEIFLAAGRGLASAHAAGLVHRDFKPQNVMVGKGGGVRVMDFGLARWVGEEELPSDSGDVADVAATPSDHARLTETGAFLGTPAYMAPEQLAGQPGDWRSDQFSFCVSLYEILFGQRPFAGPDVDSLRAQIIARRVREADRRSGVPAWLRRVVLRGLSPIPEDRWPSMEALIRTLNRGAGRTRRRRAGVAVGTLVVGLTLFGFWSAEHRRGNLCRGATQRLTGAWELDARGPRTRRSAVLDALGKRADAVASGLVDQVRELLDRYAEAWAAQYTDACEATHVRGEQSAEILDLRMGCLGRRRDDLQALTDVLSAPVSPTIADALRAASALPSLDRCKDVVSLRQVRPPPDDARVASSVARLQKSLGELAPRIETGDAPAVTEAMKPILREATELNYGRLLGEALALLGRAEAHQPQHYAAAARAYQQAFEHSFIAHDDDVAAEAAVQLVILSGEISAPGAHDAWTEIATTLLTRVGGHELLWAWLAQNRGAVLDKEGRFHEALAQMREALRRKRALLPPSHPDIETSLVTLAGELQETGDYGAALEAVTEAEAIVTRVFKPGDTEWTVFHVVRGFVLLQLERWSESLADFRVAEAGFAPGTPERLYPLLGIAHIEVAQRRPERALALLEQVLAICDRLPRFDRPACADARSTLAHTYWDLHRSVEARQAIRGARDALASLPDGRDKLASLESWVATLPAAR